MVSIRYQGKEIIKIESALCFRLSEAFGCGLYWNWVHTVSQHVEALILVLWMCTLFLDNEKCLLDILVL